MTQLLHPHSGPSADELSRLEHVAGVEFVNGQIVEKPVSAESSRIGSRINFLLRSHVEKTGKAEIYDSSLGYRCFAAEPERFRKPDVSIIHLDRLQSLEPDPGLMPIPADLVVEVISPGDIAADLEKKIEDYLNNGFNLIWIVYPNTKTVVIYRGDGTIAKLHAKDQIAGESALPGFTCNVAEFFAHPNPVQTSP
jgi:Uma2 family endonuclease